MSQFLSIQLLSAIICISTTYAQKTPSKDTTATIKLVLKNEQNLPYAHQQVALQSKKGRSFTVTTNQDGFAQATVHNDDIYYVYCLDYKCQDSIIAKNLPLMTYTYTGYSSKHCVFNITCQNKEGKPLDGELITLINVKTSEQYTTITDLQGKASIAVPHADYELNLKYLPHYQVYKADPRYERQTFNLKNTWMGTKERERRDAAEAEEARLRDEAWKRWQDSVRQDYIDKVVPLNLSIDFRNETEAFIEDIVWKKAAAFKKNLAENPKAYEQTKAQLEAYQAVAHQYQNPLLVVDTKSACFENLLLWQAMCAKEFVGKYWVANHGGTGYSITAKDAKSTIKALIHAKKEYELKESSEAETPLKAILEYTKKGIKNTAVMLLVDSHDQFYDEKNLTALSQTKMPVHLVISRMPNEPLSCQRARVYFADIAYQTKGSIFNYPTLDFAKLKEGDTFSFSDWTVKIQNGSINYTQYPQKK